MSDKPTYEELERRVKELEKKATARKWVEDVLRESEERYRNLIENINLGVTLVDADFNIVTVNTVIGKLFGKDFSEFVGKKCFREYKNQETVCAHCPGAKSMATRLPQEIETENIRADGTCFQTLVRVFPIFGPDGEVTGFAKALEDITERKKAEGELTKHRQHLEKLVEERTDKLTKSNDRLHREITERKHVANALRQSREHYRTLVENINLGITLIDTNYNIIMTNAAVARLLKKATSEFVGKKCFNEFARHKAICPYCPGIRAMDTRFPQEVETEGVRDDGTRYPLWIRAFPTFGPDGDVTGFIEIAANISKRKLIEKEKEKLEAKYQQAQKMEAVGTLAGGVAHDLNNLLQPIIGYTQLLLADKKEQDSEYSQLKEVENAAHRAAELIRQLLTFSRKIDSKLCAVDLNQEIIEVGKLLARAIPKMIKIEFDLADNLKAINADPAQIEQLLMNLAVNAKDAMPEGGELTIKTKNVKLNERFCAKHHGISPGNYALLSVHDTGYGMDKKIMEHIFEPFYSTKGPSKGTGLGLSMVYGIVKSHSGYIMCSSKFGKGTTFRIYLPEVEERVESKEVKKEIYRGGTETLLVVDDENFILDFARKVLTKYGYTVMTAPDGESALELYQQSGEQIDLIILDLNMPGMGGKQCLEKLLQVNHKVKIIISSGYSHNGSTKQTFHLGARYFLSKPFDVRQILKAIRKVLSE